MGWLEDTGAIVELSPSFFGEVEGCDDLGGVVDFVLGVLLPSGLPHPAGGSVIPLENVATPEPGGALLLIPPDAGAESCGLPQPGGGLLMPPEADAGATGFPHPGGGLLIPPEAAVEVLAVVCGLPQPGGGLAIPPEEAATGVAGLPHPGGGFTIPTVAVAGFPETAMLPTTADLADIVSLDDDGACTVVAIVLGRAYC